MSRNFHHLVKYLNPPVAPREGCVSRNGIFNNFFICYYVAPREGCVSRNRIIHPNLFKFVVAPREGCVSRNALS